MKRLSTSIRKSFHPVWIDGDDVRRLEQLLGPCGVVKIVADNVEYDSVDEFLQVSKGRRARSLKLTTREPYVVVDLDRVGANASSYSDDVTSAGVMSQVADLLRSRQRRPAFMYGLLYMILSNPALQLLFALPWFAPYKTVQAVVIFGNLVWTLWVLFIVLRGHSTIDTCEARKGFWQRNSDTAIVATITALIGAIAGVAATKMADSVWPSAPTPAGATTNRSDMPARPASATASAPEKAPATASAASS